jgi:hypothetical protein
VSRPTQVAEAPGEGDGDADREWCEAVAELIELQRAQVLALGEDSGQRMTELGNAFQVMATTIAGVAPPDGADDAQLAKSMQAAVRTLQFADAQAQRLEHLAQALEAMASLMRACGAASVDRWATLRAEMRASYTMARECEVFDRTLGPAGGRSVEAAGDAEPDVELF